MSAEPSFAELVDAFLDEWTPSVADEDRISFDIAFRSVALQLARKGAPWISPGTVNV